MRKRFRLSIAPIAVPESTASQIGMQHGHVSTVSARHVTARIRLGAQC